MRELWSDFTNYHDESKSKFQVVVITRKRLLSFSNYIYTMTAKTNCSLER